MKWKITLMVTEFDGVFEFQFMVCLEVEGSEEFADGVLEGFVYAYEKAHYVVGGGMEKIDE